MNYTKKSDLIKLDNLVSTNIVLYRYRSQHIYNVIMNHADCYSN